VIDVAGGKTLLMFDFRFSFYASLTYNLL